MQNTRLHPAAGDAADPLSPVNWANPANSRYYTVVVQYTARLNTEKLHSYLHKLNGGKVGKQFFNLRLAPEEVNDALSGYTHNAVTPVGMACSLPLILSHRIAELQPGVFFLGAGEVDLKVGLSVTQFMQAYKPMVADITY
ncbi:YbaK/aminoacyl-tRNA synthetase-associated domain-containing protein [Haematococcus lacustris]